MIDCERVFVVLTRGPFPTGEDIDHFVESHLAVCADCRRLAEALSPSDQIVRESLSAEEGRSLPRYDREQLGLAAESASRQSNLAVSPAEVAARPLARRWNPQWLSAQAARGAVAIFLAALVLCTLVEVWRPDLIATTQPLWRLSPAGQPAEGSSLAETTDHGAFEATSQVAKTSAAIAAIQEPETHAMFAVAAPCVRDDAIPPSAMSVETSDEASQPTALGLMLVGREQVQCCTKCHTHGGSRPSSDLAIAASSRQCAACHAQPRSATRGEY